MVSVIIPAYNSTEYITETLTSVLGQTYTDYEVIVVNDGSPDSEKLEEVLKPFLERIVYVKQVNQGPGSARNTAIGRARGEYIAFLDSDDYWKPDYLAVQMAKLREDPSLDLLYCDAMLFGNMPLSGRSYMQCAPSHGPVTFEALLGAQCAVLTSCAIARRQRVIDSGMFDPSLSHAEDFDLWLRIAYYGGRMDYHRHVLAYHRLHEGSLTADMTYLREAQIEVYHKVDRTLGLTPELHKLIASQLEECRASLMLEYGKRSLLKGKVGDAKEAILHANAYYGSFKLRLVLTVLRLAPNLMTQLYRRTYNSGAAGMTLKTSVDP